MTKKKNRQDINKFKKALLSNTSFIKKTENSEDSKVEKGVTSQKEYEQIIDNEILEKIDILAEYEGTTSKEMINKALSHFLRLKGGQLEQAMKEKRN